MDATANAESTAAAVTEQEPPAEAREFAPSHTEVLEHQLKAAYEKLDLMGKQLAEVLPGRTQRNREIALDSALRHHAKSGDTACQDPTVVNSAAAFFGWLENGK